MCFLLSLLGDKTNGDNNKVKYAIDAIQCK